MRRFLCLFMVCIVCIQFISTEGFAVATTDDKAASRAESMIRKYYGDNENRGKIDSELIGIVTNDLASLEVAHLDNIVNIACVDSDNNVTYKATFYGDIEDYIVVSTDTKGDVILNIREGDLSNELIYHSNGDITVDGLPAFNEDLYALSSDNSDNNTVKAGAISHLYAYSLPYGNNSIPSGFTYKSVKTGAPISLTKTLVELTIGVIISLAVDKIAGAEISFLAVTKAAITSALTTAFTNNSSQVVLLRTAYPNSKKMSYRVYTYAKNGNNSLYSEFIYSFYLYGNSALTGSPAYGGARKVIEAT